MHVSLDHRVEALFFLLMNLAHYAVDGTTDSGHAALRRPDVLSERFRVVAKGIRAFHAQNARVVASRQFQLKSAVCFNEGLQDWAEEVTRLGLLLQHEPRSMFPGPSKVRPTPLPPFART